jgi:hypothetical protein
MIKTILSILAILLVFSCSQIVKNEHDLKIINKTNVLQNIIVNDDWITLNAFEDKTIIFEGNKLNIQYHNHDTELYYIDIIVNLNEFGISAEFK